MPNLTQRQAALGVLSLMLGVGVVMFFYYALNPATNSRLLNISLAGSILVGLMLVAYWRGWEYARPTAVLIVTLVEAFAITNPREATVVSYGVFLPPILALVLTKSRGVLGSAVILWGILIIRAGGEGIYTRFSSWFIYGVCLTGLIVARLVTKTAQRAAEASAQTAHAQAAELRHTAEAIQQAEQSYRHLFENALEGIYRSSLNGQMLKANPALVRLNGYTTEAELLAAVNNIATEWYVLPHRRADFQQALEAHGHITDFESEIYRHKTRERIWISESARLVRDREGAPLWYEGTVQNITERKRAEVALTRQANQLATVAEVSAAVSTILEPHQLLRVVANLTKEKFDLYHTQIYLLDAGAQTLRLTAGAGEPGRQMLQEGWHIPLNHARSLVARTARTRLSTLVNDVQQEPDFLPNPWLPQTRSELAVPMVVGEQLLGIFDLQSEMPGCFSDEDLLVYTALARQMAVALENARRYTLAQSEIQERLQAEAALHESEEKFRLLAENLPGGVYLCRNDSDYTALYVNEAIEAVTGYAAAEFLSGQLALSDIDHPDDQAYIHAETSQAVLARRPFRLTYRIRHASGEWRWVEEVGVGVYHNDEVLYLEGFIHDITERKRAEQALRQSEERYRSVTEGLAHFIFVVQDGLVEYMNSHWSHYTGLPASASLQRGWVAVQHPEDHERLLQHWRTTMRLGQRSESEHRIRRADGQYRWHRTILQPVREEALTKTKWIGLTVDIHDQKEAEARIRQMNETLEARVHERTAQLEAANRELESFTYSVSHDLRAPLRAMDGFSRLLLQDYAAALPEEARSHLNRIRTGAQRMGALIDDLLTFARLGRQAVTKQRVAMTPLVWQVWEELQMSAAAPWVSISLHDLPECHADPTLLQQVFANLLDNARKFTRQAPAARIEVGYQRQATEVVYFVRDNGAGFDMRYVDKLFGVFQRLHAMEDYEGTGVGLAIVHRIIQRHGGRVWAEGEEGRGATFYFTVG